MRGNITLSAIYETAKRIFIVFGTLFLISGSCKAQKSSLVTQYCTNADSSLYSKILKINFDSYEDSTVSALLNEIGEKYVKYTIATLHPGYVNHVVFKFGRSISFDIAVKDLNQDKLINAGYVFNVEIFTKKHIRWIRLRCNGKCIRASKKGSCG